MIVTTQDAEFGTGAELQQYGCEILRIPPESESQSLLWLLQQLHQRGQTNVLVEGGGALLGHAFDHGLVDEVHCFIAPKIVGGQEAMRPVGGVGQSLMSRAHALDQVRVRQLENDTYITGIVSRRALDLNQVAAPIKLLHRGD
jgi:diaminohydroxyphosphoribosylaminopyrimidine deaminase/5-amino-6-(5-phosphoribosylamino)uracil reductase